MSWPWRGPEIFNLWGVIRLYWGLEDYFERKAFDSLKQVSPFMEVDPVGYAVKFYRYEFRGSQ